MRREYATEVDATEVLKEAVWLAWQAVGGPSGAGFLRDNPGATRDVVWERAYSEGDYSIRHAQGQDLNADYVFGRMMKLRIARPTPTTLDRADYKLRRDYEAWCYKYETFDALFDAAEKSVGVSQA